MNHIRAEEDECPKRQIEAFDEIAYIYDGSPEGMLCAIFEAYARRESPSDVWPIQQAAPRLLQQTIFIEANASIAARVKQGIIKQCGYASYRAVLKAALSSDPNAATAAYRFVRYGIDEHPSRTSPLSNISHPAVEPLVKICRSVDNECERVRQFARFEHLDANVHSKKETNDRSFTHSASKQLEPTTNNQIGSIASNHADFWLARISPKHSVVPLVMDHFVERFSMQAFMLYDETHGICGNYSGEGWHLVKIDDPNLFDALLPDQAEDERAMQDAWRTFYKAVSIEQRHNPELRLHFMPKRLWRNITEMQESQGEHGLGS